MGDLGSPGLVVEPLQVFDIFGDFGLLFNTIPFSRYLCLQLHAHPDYSIRTPV